MRTALVGKFDKGIMLQAHPAKVVAERCKNGMKEIKISQILDKSSTFKYSRPTRLRIGDQPLKMDPYERKMVYIKDDDFGGDGIFAKRDIDQNELVSYYGGIIWNHRELDLYTDNDTSYTW